MGASAPRDRRLSVMLTAVLSSIAWGAASANEPQVNYALHCMGCHTPDGSGVEGRVPSMRDTLVPLVSLGELFGLPHESDPCKATVVVVEDAGSRVGLVVDALLGKQEVVIKSLGETFASVRGIAGGAILGDGRIGLILDAHGIVELERGANRVAA